MIFRVWHLLTLWESSLFQTYSIIIDKSLLRNFLICSKTEFFLCFGMGRIHSNFVKSFLMATASALDNEFMQYWLKLSSGQKESLLSVAKNFVGLQATDADEFRKNLIEEEREKYLRGEGQSYSMEEVRNMALNKDQRNGL